MPTVLSGVDVDREAAIAELEGLVAALKDGNARLTELSEKHSTSVEGDSTETVTLGYYLTEEYDGIDLVQYKDRNGGGE